MSYYSSAAAAGGYYNVSLNCTHRAGVDLVNMFARHNMAIEIGCEDRCSTRYLSKYSRQYLRGRFFIEQDEASIDHDSYRLTDDGVSMDLIVSRDPRFRSCIQESHYEYLVHPFELRYRMRTDEKLKTLAD